MVQRILFVALAVLVICAVAFSGHVKKPNEQQAQIVPIEYFTQPTYSIPEAPRSLHDISIQKVSNATGTPVLIGTTDYDLSQNTGGKQILRVINGKIHFSFMERNATLTAPNNNRAMKYVWYDGTNMVSGYPVQKATSASGFGGVDAFSGGAADGYGVICGHISASVPVFVGVDGGAGAASFTTSSVPTAPQLDPSVTIDNATQTIWLLNTGYGRLQYKINKSTDYGASWASVDTDLIAMFAPKKGQIIGSLDVPIMVAPNGNLILVTTLSTSSTNTIVPPLGSGTQDSVRRIGYFLSTNKGTSWTWTDIAYSGQRFVPAAGDTLYMLPANFGQLGRVIDKSNNLHVVFNGYCNKPVKWTTAGTYYVTYFCTIYWSQATGFKRISNASDGAPMVPALTGDTLSIYDLGSYLNYRAGNSFGFCWPSIGIDPNGTTLFTAWSQPRLLGSVLDTMWDGHMKYDVWYNYSLNNGSSWTTAAKLANTDMGLYGFVNRDLTTSTSGVNKTFSAHLVYLADTCGGQSTATTAHNGGSTKLVNWYYQKVDFVTTGVSNGMNQPERFTLDQNYPNPFNPSTSIRFTLQTSSDVKVTVLNILGQEVATILNSKVGPGEHLINFNASGLTSGVYIYQLSANGLTETKKMVLLK
jgi:hypothetical protein